MGLSQLLKIGGLLFFKRFSNGFISILKTSPMLRAGLGILLLIVLMAIFEPLINGYLLKGHKSTEFGLFERLLPPSYEHPLGTDHFGRDLFALQLTGLLYSLVIGLIAGGVATIIAVVIAVTAGYTGGKLDAILNSATNAILVIPSLPILIAITAYVRMDLILMSLTLAVFSWPGAARATRAQILSLKEMSYVELAKVSALNKVEIMFTEILPNLIPYIIVGFANAIVGAILAETGLRMIGLGPSEIPSIGFLLNRAMDSGALAQGYYQMVLAPAFLLILTFISLNLINVGLEEVFNPRLKKITGG